MSGDNIRIRAYNHKRDFEDIRKVWHEAGWMEFENTQFMNVFFQSGRITVADVNGSAESMALTITGELIHQKNRLNMCVVGAVTTGHIARKLGLARKITACRIAEDAAMGAHISTLGMFEQGFYNTLGFGTASYIHITTFQPSSLKRLPKHRIPCRLTAKDAEEIHATRMLQMPCHGKAYLPFEHTLAEINWKKSSFGLGFRDKNGTLTHHLWLSGKGKEQGPYKVEWMAYQNTDQMLELLSLLKSMGDQIHSVQMFEPPHIQFQDILDKPFFFRSITKNSTHESGMKTSAFFQIRILNLEETLERTVLNCDDFQFILKLNDPIETFLPKDSPWKGCGGTYLVTLGKKCSAVKNPGRHNLPIMECSVNAFSRIWLGVRPASVLKATDDINGEPELIEKLDLAFASLPVPHFYWEF